MGSNHHRTGRGNRVLVGILYDMDASPGAFGWWTAPATVVNGWVNEDIDDQIFLIEDEGRLHLHGHHRSFANPQV
jgi:hypothetical protein